MGIRRLRPFIFKKKSDIDTYLSVGFKAGIHFKVAQT